MSENDAITENCELRIEDTVLTTANTTPATTTSKIELSRKKERKSEQREETRETGEKMMILFFVAPRAKNFTEFIFRKHEWMRAWSLILKFFSRLRWLDILSLVWKWYKKAVHYHAMTTLLIFPLSFTSFFVVFFFCRFRNAIAQINQPKWNRKNIAKIGPIPFVSCLSIHFLFRYKMSDWLLTVIKIEQNKKVTLQFQHFFFWLVFRFFDFFFIFVFGYTQICVSFYFNFGNSFFGQTRFAHFNFVVHLTWIKQKKRETQNRCKLFNYVSNDEKTNKNWLTIE